jgi:hypothetical protein
MIRDFRAGGAVVAFLGVGLIPPALVGGLEQERISELGIVILSLAAVLVLSGLVAIVLGRLRSEGLSRPAPVRAVILANLCFLAFCSLEVSDGLLRQGGRIFYWTTVLFVPALGLYCGVILAQRWAWWTARGFALIFVVWFSVFVLLIPFVEMRGSSGPVPWYGRVYMIGVSTIFASIAAYVFHALGRAETKTYFGMPEKASVTTLS